MWSAEEYCPASCYGAVFIGIGERVSVCVGDRVLERSSVVYIYIYIYIERESVYTCVCIDAYAFT